MLEIYFRDYAISHTYIPFLNKTTDLNSELAFLSMSVSIVSLAQLKIT